MGSNLKTRKTAGNWKRFTAPKVKVFHSALLKSTQSIFFFVNSILADADCFIQQNSKTHDAFVF